MSRITECSVTFSSRYFLPEVISGQRSVNNQLENVTNALLYDSSIPDAEVSIGDLGRSTGKWDFFNRLYPPERDTVFDYAPMFLIPRDNWRITPFFTHDRFEDSKVSIRVLYYPFGLFVVRARIYLKFKDPQSPGEFADIRDDLQQKIHPYKCSKDGSCRSNHPNWYSNNNTISLLEECLRWAFSEDIPNHHWGRLSEVPIHQTTYVYDDIEPNDNELATLVTGDARPTSEDHISRWATPQFGDLKNDVLVTKPQGSVLITPYFSNINASSRRWKRIQLLNNKYLSTDFAIFKRQFSVTVLRELRQLLDEISSGSLTGDPIEPKRLVMIREAFTFGSSLRGIRHRFYDELAPTESEVGQVDSYINRIVDHDPKLREGVKNLIPRLF